MQSYLRDRERPRWSRRSHGTRPWSPHSRAPTRISLTGRSSVGSSDVYGADADASQLPGPKIKLSTCTILRARIPCNCDSHDFNHVVGLNIVEMRPERRALDKLYKRRDRYDIPDWQRNEVWNVEKKRLLIDSILRGWKLPKFYFQKTHESPDEFDVVDGQQRLSAIIDFFDNNLTLSETSASRFGGSTYKELPDSVSDRFDDYEIEYDEITNATDEEITEFFQRLQAGLPLNSSEKLNAIPSKLRNFCSSTAEDRFFSDTTVIVDKRYAYFDIVAKVAVLEIEGLNTGLRYDDVSAVFLTNATFSPQSAVAKRIRKALRFLSESFPKSFRGFRHRTIVQSIITFVCHLLEEGLDSKQGKTLRSFIQYFLKESSVQVELGQEATDYDFIEFHRSINANVKSAARTRQTILLRKIFQQYPEFYSLLRDSRDVELGHVGDIRTMAESIRELVEECNELYSGRNGKDLFKPTNKTTGALVDIGRPARSFDDYKSLIDRLYFLFREGCGQRISSPPSSFVDLNDLRTMLQHDVDHGKESKISAKRKALSATFAKYAGVGSPLTVGPKIFLLVQMNILIAIRSDLESLSRSLQ